MVVVSNSPTSSSKGGGGGRQSKFNVMGAMVPTVSLLFALCNDLFWVPNLQMARENQLLVGGGGEESSNAQPTLLLNKKQHPKKTRFIDDTENMYKYTQPHGGNPWNVFWSAPWIESSTWRLPPSFLVGW